MSVTIKYSNGDIATVADGSEAVLQTAGELMRQHVGACFDSAGYVAYNNSVTNCASGETARLICGNKRMKHDIYVCAIESADLLYDFRGQDFRRAIMQIGAGPFGTGNTVLYTNTDTTNRLIVGNEGHDPVITVPTGCAVRIEFAGSAAQQGAIRFVLQSGAAKVANKSSSNFVQNTDYVDTGWLSSGGTYDVPDDTQYIWLNFRRADNSTITQSDLYYFKIFVIPKV